MARRLLRGFGVILIAFPEPFTTVLGVTLLFASYTQFRKQRPDSYERLQPLLENWAGYYQPIGYMVFTRQTAAGRIPRTPYNSLPCRKTGVGGPLKLTDSLESLGRRWRDSERRRSLLVMDMSARLRREAVGVRPGCVMPEKWPWGAQQRGRRQPLHSRVRGICC